MVAPSLLPAPAAAAAVASGGSAKLHDLAGGPSPVVARQDPVRADDIALDVVIGHAVRVGWRDTHPEQPTEDYPLHKATAWEQFYRSSPAECRQWQIQALRELAEQAGLN